MLKYKRHIRVLFGLTFFTSAVLLLVVSIERRAAADTQPTPTPASQDAIRSVATPLVTSPMNREVFVPPPAIAAAFRGKAVHLSASSYSYDVGGIDPTNGKQTTIDTWFQTDENSNLVKLHSISTLPDGTFLQEVVEGNGQRIIAFGPPYASLQPSVGNPCTPARVSGSRPILPLFVNPATLPQLGYSPAQGRSVEPPAAPSNTPVAVAPIATYSVDDSLSTWVRPGVSDSNGTVRFEIEVQSNGKLDATRSITMNGQGQVVSENWQATGPVSVYNPSSTPAEVFALSASGREACGE